VSLAYLLVIQTVTRQMFSEESLTSTYHGDVTMVDKLLNFAMQNKSPSVLVMVVCDQFY
jgi:hypothetical protein